MRLYVITLAVAASLLVNACGDAADSNRATNTNSRTANVAATNAPRAAAPSSAAPTPDELAAARGVYARECQRCHKPEGQGGVFEEEGLKPLEVPSLRDGHALTHDDQRLARKIANGDDGMPSFKNKLTPEEIGQLVRLIRKDFQGRTNAAGAPNPNEPASAH